MNRMRLVADEALWRNSMLPNGVLERWLICDGAEACEGHAVAQLRIEDALHDVVAPATGHLTILVPTHAIIEPGLLLATLTVQAPAATGI